MKIIIWNVQYAKPGTKREKLIHDILIQESPDITCITEGYIQSWSNYENVICSHKDYGYKIYDGRRKVILISKDSWNSVDITGNKQLPSGRFVSGITHNLQIVGVCIPWRDAHVRSGRKDKKIWEDHLAYLSGLKKYLEQLSEPTIVVGDYNQCIPKKNSTKIAFELLMSTFQNYKIQSQDVILPIEKQAIDHISTQGVDKTLTINSIDNVQYGVRLSDHFGLIVNW